MRTSKIVVACLAAVLLCTALAAAQPTPALRGTVIDPPKAAADFSLVDQRGQAFRLSSARGKAVVLSFIYTHCEDICPFVTLKLKEARELLGKDADKAVFVTVTTDPERDTPAVTASYSKAAGLYEHWHFLTGPLAEVKKVWAAYGVGVHAAKDAHKGDSVGMEGMEDDHSQGLSKADISLAKTMIAKFSGGYEVSHAAPFWIIDADGKLRAILNADAVPSDIVADVRALVPRK